MAGSTRGRYLVLALAVVSFLAYFIVEPSSTAAQKACCATAAAAFANGGDAVDILAVLLLASVAIAPLGLTKSSRYLIVALALVVLLVVLLSPLGLDSRLAPKGAAYATWATWRIVGLYAGSLFCYASIAAFPWRPRTASVAAIAGGVLLIVEFLGDQLRLMKWTPPPTLVTVLELAGSAVVIAILYLGSKSYMENAPVAA
jgi:hypothetical protein